MDLWSLSLLGSVKPLLLSFYFLFFIILFFFAKFKGTEAWILSCWTAELLKWVYPYVLTIHFSFVNRKLKWVIRSSFQTFISKSVVNVASEWKWTLYWPRKDYAGELKANDLCWICATITWWVFCENGFCLEISIRFNSTFPLQCNNAGVLETTRLKQLKTFKKIKTENKT